jgi:hypothetical protein
VRRTHYTISIYRLVPGTVPRLRQRFLFCSGRTWRCTRTGSRRP